MLRVRYVEQADSIVLKSGKQVLKMKRASKNKDNNDTSMSDYSLMSEYNTSMRIKIESGVMPEPAEHHHWEPTSISGSFSESFSAASPRSALRDMSNAGLHTQPKVKGKKSAGKSTAGDSTGKKKKRSKKRKSRGEHGAVVSGHHHPHLSPGYLIDMAMMPAIATNNGASPLRPGLGGAQPPSPIACDSIMPGTQPWDA